LAQEIRLSRVLRQCDQERGGVERIVFVNASPECAESDHFEPDREWRHGYLAATGRTLRIALTAAVEPPRGHVKAR
jgi:hypothetical protein